MVWMSLLILVDLRLQRGAMRFKRGQDVKIRAVDHAPDVVERHIQLAIEEDLLQAVQGLLAVVAVAVRSDRASASTGRSGRSDAGCGPSRQREWRVA